MTHDSSKSRDDQHRWHIPSVGVLTLFTVMVIVGLAVFSWRVSRSGIRQVESLGGFAGGNWNLILDFLSDWIGADDAVDAMNDARYTTDGGVRFVYFRGLHVDDDSINVFQRFRNLEAVQLKETSVTDQTLLEIGEISQLNNVMLSDSSGITDKGIAALGKLPNLRQASLEGLSISGANLGDLKHLEILYLNRCPRLGPTVLQELCEIPNLRILHLDTSHMTDVCFHDIKGSSKLEELNLYRTKITDSSLTILGDQFPHLKILDLDGIDGITDSGVQQLTRLKMLEQVSLDESQTSKQAAKSLQESMPHCKVHHESLDG